MAHRIETSIFFYSHNVIDSSKLLPRRNNWQNYFLVTHQVYLKIGGYRKKCSASFITIHDAALAYGNRRAAGSCNKATGSSNEIDVTHATNLITVVSAFAAFEVQITEFTGNCIRKIKEGFIRQSVLNSIINSKE